MPTKDPAELAVANDPAAVAATLAYGCTSVASRGAGGAPAAPLPESNAAARDLGTACPGIYLL